MSTEGEAKTNTYRLTRGALYLLEALCQNPEPWKDSLPLTRRANTLWDKLRKLNPAKKDGHDFEKPALKRKDEDQLDFNQRAQEFQNAFSAWRDEEAELVLSKKHEDALVKGLVWGFKHREKWAHENNQHVASILAAFGDLLDIEAE